MSTKIIPSYANELIVEEPIRQIHGELYENLDYDAIWKLSNAGFVIRIGGEYIFVDPVFTSPIPPKGRSGRKGFRRTIPEAKFYDRNENFWKEVHSLPLPPEKVSKADYVLITHGCGDHLDKQGMSRISGLNPRVLVPPYWHNTLMEAGISKERLIGALAGERIDLGKFAVQVVPADHTAYQREENYGACGFLIMTKYGNIYHPGDGCFDHPGKEAILGLDVDYLLLPINDTNLGAGFGALLTSLLQPKVVIPCHYGYTYPPIRSQGGHPAEFVTALAARNYKIPCTDIVILQPGGKFVFV